ncbi:U3 small nucleolar ribonucleoprotein protein IMP3 [Uncinocarpus reesii 1704]|uniref:U3 small nucleolar ribonucleoprotein protein IMP3 n=1 Tax=Uncinocarpus reesii (strain UAMH 1704) TaxID=336963 RepID=C4JEI6_UNCRE|nr:U3 small nucleolar ribonucleoprotein IMP3 [Uncinocarpus reesii 1704]EEP75978.1 U3 small nucleolar ribonucleoprotein protein IMP3 [Uncinocarpus reesii 1704]
MVRKLKHHEKSNISNTSSPRLLRKVDLYTYKSDNNHRETTIRQRYHLQDPLDYKKYNALCGSVRQLAHKLSAMDPESPFRREMEAQMLEKLWAMGILKQNREQGAGLSRVEREVTVSAFARRRLGVLMSRNGMVESVSAAVKFIEQGHVRVGTEVVTDPAFLVTRNLEDYVTWVDSSKIKRNILQYREKLDDFDLL